MNYQTPADVDDFDTDGATSGMAPAERIRALNDMLRTTGIGGKTRLTSGLVAKGSDFVAHAVSAVVMMPGESDSISRVHCEKPPTSRS